MRRFSAIKGCIAKAALSACLLLCAATSQSGIHILSDQEEASYIHTGDYNNNLVSQLALARDYLDLRLSMNTHWHRPKNFAVVFGINDTALAHERRLKQLFIHPPDTHITLRLKDEPVIWAVRAFYDYVKSKQVPIYFVTERFEHEREQTEHNLAREGYQGWAGLLMRPEDTKVSVEVDETQARTRLEKKGTEVMLTINSDLKGLKGGHSTRVVWLPKPDRHHAKTQQGLKTLG